MAEEPKLLAELFHNTLKDIYFAEKKILATLPKMAGGGAVHSIISRLMHRSKQHLYSITSSADYGPRSMLNRPSLGGTLLPCVPQGRPISR